MMFKLVHLVVFNNLCGAILFSYAVHLLMTTVECISFIRWLFVFGLFFSFSVCLFLDQLLMVCMILQLRNVYHYVDIDG